MHRVPSVPSGPALLLALLLTATAACRSEAGPEEVGTQGPPELPAEPGVDRDESGSLREGPEPYRGPPLTARLRTGVEGSRILVVSVEAPTGGYALQHDDTVQQQGVTKVRMTLQRPGPTEMVTQALETLRQRASLDDAGERVLVLVKTVQRGVDPAGRVEYRLASELRVP